MTQSVGAIVTLIPRTLEYRGSLNQAILNAAGEELDQFVLDHIIQPRIGDIYPVPAFRLPCQHIFFCVVPVWRDRDDFERYDRDLVNACRKAMDLARALSLKTLAFPPLGMGRHGFPKPRGVRLMLEGILSRLNSDIEEVRIVCKSKKTVHLFQDRLVVP